jgi:probable phosphoglycerate mutase
VAARADAVLARVRLIEADVLLFSSGHFLRVLAARWLELSVLGAKYFVLSTASVSELSYEMNRSEPVIQLWNDTSHLKASNQGDNGSNTQAEVNSLWAQKQ